MSQRNTFSDFVAAVCERLDAGARAYGDRSFDRPALELLDEVAEELLDVAGWSFVLWCRLRRLREAVEKIDARESPESDEPEPARADLRTEAPTFSGNGKVTT